jgi:hypothetical protein
MLHAEERDSADRRRARHAYTKITCSGELDAVCARAQALPIEVRTQGLTTVVATLLKNERRTECRALADWLEVWLMRDSGLVKLESATPGALLKWATTCSRDEYHALQAEALAYLEHVKRLLSALREAKGA